MARAYTFGRRSRSGGRAVLGGVLLAAALGCAESPLGRQRLLLMPDAEVAELGATAFEQMQREQPVAQAPRELGRVSCVVRALAAEADVGEPPPSWEVAIFEDETANAFALPGGKIGVNTGMLEIVANDSQLATVLGHEIAHVLAEHTNERLSTGSLAEGGLAALQALLGTDTPGRETLLAALGVGAQVGVLLPFDRAQESEADLLGLGFMAKAGFDPRESLEFWRAMERAGGAAPPEFLSTHPANATRIAALEQALPEALELARGGERPNCGS
jgi:predicted Zn-dependent protease